MGSELRHWRGGVGSGDLNPSVPARHGQAVEGNRIWRLEEPVCAFVYFSQELSFIIDSGAKSGIFASLMSGEVIPLEV